MAQMRSPSPEADTTSLSDLHAAPAQRSSRTSPTGRSVEAARPAAAKTARAAVDARADSSRVEPAAAMPDYETLRPGSSRPIDSASLTVHGSAANATQAEQPAEHLPSQKDAAQQALHSAAKAPPRTQDSSVQSELPIMPTAQRQVPNAWPTDERGTQTPLGHASPRALQRAPPGRDAQCPSTSHTHMVNSQQPGHLSRHVLRHDEAGSPQVPAQALFSDYQPRMQSPTHQSTFPDDHVAADTMHARRDLSSVFATDPFFGPSSEQHLQKSIRDSAHSHMTMQSSDTKVAEQSLHAAKLKADSAHQASGASFSAQPVAGSMQHPAGSLPGDSSDSHHAQAAPASVQLHMPRLAPRLTEPSMPPMTGQLPLQLPAHLLNEMPSHAHFQIPPTQHYMTTQPRVHSFEHPQRPPFPLTPTYVSVSTGASLADMWPAPGNRSASVMQRQQGAPAMHTLPRRMYAGITCSWNGAVSVLSEPISTCCYHACLLNSKPCPIVAFMWYTC